jgi:hypothetical protein
MKSNLQDYNVLILYQRQQFKTILRIIGAGINTFIITGNTDFNFLNQQQDFEL